MPDRDAADHYEVSEGIAKFVIGLLYILLILGLSVLVFGGFVFFADEFATAPITVPFVVFAISTLFAGSFVLVVLSRIRRERRWLVLLRAEHPRIACSPGGLSFTSRSRSHIYDWAEFRAVQTDRDYLALGPIPMPDLRALLLLDHRAPQRPTLGLRRALGRAIRRATVFPVDIDGITAIPLTVFEGRDTARLVKQAVDGHRRAVG